MSRHPHAYRLPHIEQASVAAGRLLAHRPWAQLTMAAVADLTPFARATLCRATDFDGLRHAVVGRWRRVLAELVLRQRLTDREDLATLLARISDLAEAEMGSAQLAWGMTQLTPLDPLARDLCRPKWRDELRALAGHPTHDATVVAAPTLWAFLRRAGVPLAPFDAARMARGMCYGWLEDGGSSGAPLQDGTPAEIEALARTLRPQELSTPDLLAQFARPTGRGAIDFESAAKLQQLTRSQLQTRLTHVEEILVEMVSAALSFLENALAETPLRLDRVLAAFYTAAQRYRAFWPIVMVTRHRDAATVLVRDAAADLGPLLAAACPAGVRPEDRAAFLMALLAPALVPATPDPAFDRWPNRTLRGWTRS